MQLIIEGDRMNCLLKSRLSPMLLCAVLLWCSAGCAADNETPENFSSVVVYSQISDVEQSEPDVLSSYDVPQDKDIIVFPDTSQVLDFQKNDNLDYKISNVVYDDHNEIYAVLYIVTDDNGRWKYRGGDLLHIQLFDKQGNFQKHIATELESIADTESNIKPSDPCIYRDGMLTFFSYSPYKNFIFFNTTTESYTSVQARFCTADGDYFLINDGGVKGNVWSYDYTLSLYHRDQPVAAIDITVNDFNFNYPEHYNYAKEVFTLDSQEKTAVFGNSKITFTMDFNTGTWTMERHYIKDHLQWLLATSPDGRWEVYLADESSAGDASWADVVSLDTMSGEITFLTENVSGATAVFGMGNKFLYKQADGLRLIDVENAQVINEIYKSIINGITYDADNDWYLVIWCSPIEDVNYYDPENKVPAMLDIYDKDAELVRTMNTGLLIRPLDMHWAASLSLQIEEDGLLTIFDRNEEELGKVRYMND